MNVVWGDQVFYSHLRAPSWKVAWSSSSLSLGVGGGTLSLRVTSVDVR